MPQRATRVHLTVPVLVFGTNESGTPFEEATETALVMVNGALIGLVNPIEIKHKLLLVNINTGAKIACHVTTLRPPQNGKTQVGIRFDEPSPRFWGVGFPPEDWDPADRKRPEPRRR